MPQISAYINFDGKCREAMTFYQQCLGGELTFQTIGESPMCDHFSPEDHDRIMHSMLAQGSTVLMASDMPDPQGHVIGNNMALAANFESEDGIRTSYARLAQGGEATHPVTDSPWGSLFGHLVDQYGVVWLLNFERGGRSAAEADAPFIISRTFDAPRDLVFRMWTERDHLARWWGPKGFVVDTAKLDLRPGGTFHYHMRNAVGVDMWGRWTFVEIATPERLVIINGFSNEQGEITLPPFAERWPKEIMSTFLFEECDGKTTVTVSSTAHNASKQELDTFMAGFGSMNQGWSGTLEQFEEYLRQSSR